ncbi:hypothetical protein ACFHYQ_23875 [Sphaerimonospora cavernae]|uniref:Uncharacterized protein n=1 Tax=Sphaerimonospora cavernae TaxID=1740611 RepID=A0ABV6UAV7_9ACTN
MRSQHGSGLIGQEFDELVGPVLGLLLDERGWRSAAYAASPFLIVMSRIVPHLGSANHPAACSGRLGIAPGSGEILELTCGNVAEIIPDRFRECPLSAESDGVRLRGRPWRDQENAQVSRGSG